MGLNNETLEKQVKLAIENNIRASAKEVIQEILENVTCDYTNLARLYKTNDTIAKGTGTEWSNCASCGVSWKYETLVICKDKRFRCSKCREDLF